MPKNSLKALDQDWSNYWQGRMGTESGTALVGVERHPEIKNFWIDNLSNFSRDIAALDLCCGAGTVAKILDEMGFENLTGADISEAAIKIITQSLPGITGVVSPADKMPFADREFGLVVSQYGFEYGEYKKVIPEICRILKANGVFIALSHHVDGAIHQEVADQKDEMKQIRQSGYIEAARDMFRTAMSRSTKKSPQEIAAIFRQAQLKLFSIAQRKRGLAEYLYMNTQQMYASHDKYQFEDVMKWFDGIENDIDRFFGRMESMHNSAIDPPKLRDMVSVFGENGVEIETPLSLSDETGASLGWIFKGVKT